MNVQDRRAETLTIHVNHAWNRHGIIAVEHCLLCKYFLTDNQTINECNYILV